MNPYLQTILNLVRKSKSYEREATIDAILSTTEKNYNQLFINEIRDHLSTIINKSQFTDATWFRNPDRFMDIPTCNCKSYIQTEEEFINFLDVLHSEYKGQKDFDIGEVVTRNIYLNFKSYKNEEK